MRALHVERHRTERIGWLRAAVLGENDGIVSTASLVVGVAAANAGASEILVAGVAGLVAGAMSMAAGEYVSVSSQADTETPDVERERNELAADNKFEHEEVLGRAIGSLAMSIFSRYCAVAAFAPHVWRSSSTATGQGPRIFGSASADVWFYTRGLVAKFAITRGRRPASTRS
jgi:hypothetical protein